MEYIFFFWGTILERKVFTLTEAWANVPKLGLYFLKSTDPINSFMFSTNRKQEISNLNIHYEWNN